MTRNPDFSLRLARPADDAVLSQLDADVWSPLHAVTPRRTPSDGSFFENCRPENHVVAELDGEVVGYVRMKCPTSLPSNAHVWEIRGLAVAPKARGRGIARALLEAAMEEARRGGARRMSLRVLGHNTPARRLYESMGFVVEGVQPEEFFLDGVYVDDVLMGRKL